MTRHKDDWFFGDFIADALRDSARTWKWEWKDRYGLFCMKNG